MATIQRNLHVFLNVLNSFTSTCLKICNHVYLLFMIEFLVFFTIVSIVLWYIVWKCFWPQTDEYTDVDMSIPIRSIRVTATVDDRLECFYGANTGWVWTKREDIVAHLLHHQQPIPHIFGDIVDGTKRINWGNDLLSVEK